MEELTSVIAPTSISEQVQVYGKKTRIPFPHDRTIHELFEEQAEKKPDQAAVYFNERHITYRELNERANRLAWTLRNKSVGPGQVVAIMAERSVEMIVGLFAILKSGAAYLPISPADPGQRTGFMLDDSNAVLLLAQKKLKDRAGNFKGEVIDLEDETAYMAASVSNLPRTAGPGDLAYIIYTSGSTGKPKGVMIEHASVLNRLTWMQRRYPITEKDTLLQKTSFTFDVSVWELFWWALEGAKVCMLAPGAERVPLAIAEAVQKYNVSIMHFVPSMLNAFIDYVDETAHLEKLAGVRWVFASGEALSPLHVKKFNKTLYRKWKTRLTNLYGPTEATVDVSYYDCPPGEDLKKVPIGKPIDNIQLFILPDSGQPAADGSGELGIAGAGLARGYLNREALTREKFVEHPFHPGERMYRTGDLVRGLPDGNIEFLGRMDYQVKISGLRIELNEIEAVLAEHETVNDCVVVVKEQAANLVLIVAYVVLKEDGSVDALKKHLRSFLPDYMIPNVFVKMEKLPLNANGKIDRPALPEAVIELSPPRPAKTANDRTLPFSLEEMKAVIDKFPTPFHIYDEQRLIDTSRRLKKAFAWHPGFRQYFALKATPNPNILKVFIKEGFGADCSSLTELVLAEKCSLRGENVMFSANVPPPAEFQKAKQMGVIINLDDISHIAFLEKTAGLPEVISLRYNPGDVREGNIFLGKLCEAKFGFTKDQLFDGYRILKEKGIRRFGLHTMIATQMLDPHFFIMNAQMLLDLAVEISRTLEIKFEFINLGGGIGIPYRPHEKAVDLDFVGEGVRRAYEKTILDKGLDPINIYMESGRMMTGQSGYMVARVIHKKATYKNYVGLDASMANLMRIGMYGEYHHITVMGKEHLPADHVYDVIGSLCENNDKFAINRNLPRVDIGDIIVIHDTGAHGHAMGFNYNGKLRSAELLLKTNKEVIQIRRPETLEDHFSTLLYVM